MRLFLNSAPVLRLLLIVSLGFVSVSCLNEEVCEDVATVPVRIGFYRLSTATGKADPLTISGFTAYGVGRDSIIYNNQNRVGQFELPLNSTADSCAFVLKLSSSQFPGEVYNDTIWLYYSIKPLLISLDCGFVTFYQLNKVRYTQSLIDSVAIDNNQIINSLDEHIKIFPSSYITGN